MPQFNGICHLHHSIQYAQTGIGNVIYFRFLIEFVRVPDAHIGYLAADWVTMGQVLSAPMILIGATMLVMAYGRKNKEAKA